MSIRRRHFLRNAGLGALATGLAGWQFLRPAPAASAGNGAPEAAEAYAVTHTDAEWRAMLTGPQYAVLRREGTERPYSSPLNDEHRPGIFSCAGCQLALFSSKTKFDSGTGWPSFWRPLDNAVRTHEDRSFGMVRSAVSCSSCGGHLGHVFDDGPRPTGLRYCMNGVAMTFKEQAV
ncbi:peptide-methionine (R)-S-oxide reductase [Bordetella genomosp. 10]|uniref:peptide-methionine (R)-S-oxide reductase n=1 Tax=Bordetella genomosp. 10 TaxID=1416804 RepID=A0A261RZJ8_9BORD|nr:peptide-methionine (R)-S-oxide reductase MsrB [Bordetella genomosp. 10]OZI30528.1 peptide-methionine (R)-S-oxide reductase [Bordetella genomosp. 10]